MAALAAAGGLATLISLGGIPAGLYARQPAALAAAAFTSARFVAAFLAVIALLLGVRALARRSATAPAADETCFEPLFWGASAPLLSLLLDPWFFHRTAPVLAAAGVGLGLICALGRGATVGPAAPFARGRRATAVIVGAAIALPSLLVLPGPPPFQGLSGDEPHYLVIARSLWVDGDVDVANEYADDLTAPFWRGDLAPHAKPGIDPARRYSIHGVGLAFWLAPWFAIGRDLSMPAFTALVRIAMALWLGAAAYVLLALTRAIAGEKAALRGTALAVFTLPLVFAGPHLFPAVPVFVLSGAAYLLLRGGPNARQAGLAGLCLALLPWLHFKFSGLVAALCAIGLVAIWRGSASAGRRAASVALLAPPAATGLAHMAMTWTLYRRLSPLAIPVGADPALRASAFGDDWSAYLGDPWGAVSTGLGYLFDQREGLLFYAPQYLLAIAGLAWLARRRRFDAVALAVSFLSVVGPYALSQEIGRWGPPARPVTGALWALCVPMAIGLVIPAGEGGAGRLRASFRALLVTWGIGATALLLTQPDLLYHDFNVPRALVLLRYGAPGLGLSDLAPVWLGPDAVRPPASLAWLTIGAAVAVWSWKWGVAASSVKDLDQPAPAPLFLTAAAFRAATVALLLATVLLLAHHARVPLSELHQPWAFEPVRYWKPQNPPTRAWISERGVWTGGEDSVHLLLSSHRPLRSIVLQLDALTPMEAEIQAGRDRRAYDIAPQQRNLARLTPGPALRWGDDYFYHLHVTAPDSMSRAQLGIDDDNRSLGVYLQLVETEFE